MAKKSKSEAVPAMDYPEHERTYQNFLKLFKWSTMSMVILLILMALFLL
ncbi:MAG: aa3-type cytochrome c oxidase subunit IV [Hyphomicrobiales bacterium]|nr:aa3-type cytochrome c oxidase subunit IV [Hyphomicrobiales bacterium]